PLPLGVKVTPGDQVTA
ncbi:hypothetical protein, partial [Chlamydia trachomatis]